MSRRVTGWCRYALLCLICLWAAPAHAVVSGPHGGSAESVTPVVRIAIAPIPDADDEWRRQLGNALQSAVSSAPYLSGRAEVILTTEPVAPAGLPTEPAPASIPPDAAAATLLVWGRAGDAGTIELFLIQLYTLDPVYQATQAGRARPILPAHIRLPNMTSGDPIKAVYALLGVSYLEIGAFDAAAQVLSILNDFPDLSQAERLPVVFSIAASELTLGLVAGDPARTDRAMYHLGALKSVIRDDETPELAGAIHITRGLAYEKHPTRQGTAMLTEAISDYEAALHFFTADHFPVMRAGLLHQIASVEQQFPPDRDGYHLFRAIALYRRALTVWNAETYPDPYGAALHNMALCYQRLPVGDRTYNLLAAITLYRRSLVVRDPQTRPLQAASTFGNMGQAYQALPPQPDGHNLILAAAAYNEALRYWTAERNPAQFANYQQLTGQVFQEMPVGDRRENLSRALFHFEQALSVTPRDQQPMAWALLQVKRGVVLATLPPPGRRRALTLAEEAFQQALDVITPDNLPYYHSQLLHNLEEVRRQRAALDVPQPESSGNPSPQTP